MSNRCSRTQTHMAPHQQSQEHVGMVHLSKVYFIEEGDRKTEGFRWESRRESGKLLKRALVITLGHLKDWSTALPSTAARIKTESHWGECSGPTDVTAPWILGVTQGQTSQSSASSWLRWQQRCHPRDSVRYYWCFSKLRKDLSLVFRCDYSKLNKKRRKEVAGRNINLKRH